MPKSDPATPRYLTPQQVADILATSRMSVHRAIDRGDLRAFRDGRLVRIAPADVTVYVEAHSGGGGAGRRHR
jgi:excisionase family DNA binding protein